MKNKINFLHDSMHYCSGYQEFLEDKKLGNPYKWNWQFFLFFMQWLIIHKMYAHVFIIIFFYLNLTTFFLTFFPASFLSMPTVAFGFLAFHIFLTFISHNLYHIHLENKFYKVNYDPIKSEKIAKPYPFYITVTLFFVIPALTILCFNLLYRLGK